MQITNIENVSQCINKKDKLNFMESFQPFGKYLIIIGLVVVAIGLILMFSDKIPFLGKLPGDITIRKENFTFYFPIVTSIIISILLSLIFYFISRMKK